jgi:hypothetical protein
MHTLTGLLTAAMALCSSAAWADTTPPQDSVTLKNGAIYSGEIVEKVPGDHETLQLATGEVKRFEWADIVPPAPPPPPPVPPPVTVVAAPPARQVHVKLDTDNVNTTLEAYAGEGMVIDGDGRVSLVDEGTPVCTAPCDKSLDGGRYRVNGTGIAPSGWFDMPLDADNLVLHVKTASQAAKITGIIMAASCIGVGVGGGVPFYVIGSVSHTYPDDGGNQTLKDVGVGFMVLGAAMLVVGIPLWIANNSSSVRTDAGGSLARAPLGAISF